MPVRRKSNHLARKQIKSLWQARKSTIKYLLYFGIGLILGSLAAVICGSESIPFRILLNQLAILPKHGLWTLWREKLLYAAIIVLYLLIAARCLWGNPLILVTPILFGVGQGAIITFLLMLLGWKGLTYILMSSILPKTVQLAAIILLCNTAQSDLKRLSGGENITQALLWVVGAVLFAAGALLQTVMQIKLSSGIIA